LISTSYFNGLPSNMQQCVGVCIKCCKCMHVLQTFALELCKCTSGSACSSQIIADSVYFMSLGLSRFCSCKGIPELAVQSIASIALHYSMHTLNIYDIFMGRLAQALCNHCD